MLPTLSFSPRSSQRVDSALGPQAETCLLFNSGERLADMSDVEENNFEGRVSTKPREPSSAAARCSGSHEDERGRAGVRAGSLAGTRGEQPLEPSRLLPPIPRWLLGSTPAPNTPGHPLPRFRSLTDAWIPGSDSPPPPLSLPALCSEVWVPVAVGRAETAGSSPPTG